MSWLERFKRLFGSHEPDANVVADAPPAPPAGKKLVTPAGAAKKWARIMPGAVLEDFGDRPRDDGLLARVTYSHDGALLRLVIHRDEEGLDPAVWLETRCPGVFGTFWLFRCDVGETFAADEPRLFFTHSSYVFGPRMRNEVARLLTLPESCHEQLVALSGKVECLALEEQVLSAHLGDLAWLVELLERRPRRLLELGAELAFLGTQFPPLEREVADLAEARTCRHCGASFVFAPHLPNCVRCGAPADTAVPMPAREYMEIPDDALVDVEAPGAAERMESNRALAAALCELVDEPRVREEPERARVFVEYSLAGRAYRAKIMADHVGLRTAATGADGDFYLRWSNQDVDGIINHGTPWREGERKVFFSRHCRVRSDHTTKEAARIASLPVAARALLTGLCEKFEFHAQLEDGFLAQGLGHAAHTHGVQAIVQCSGDLAIIADALPRDFDPDDVAHYRLESCSHCGWEYFFETGHPGCLHCGAQEAAPSKG